MAKSRAGFVFMTHPDVKAPPVEVPKKSFDRYWSKKKWVEVDAPSASGPEETPLSDMKRDELDALATQRGLDPASFSNKAEIVAALENGV